MLQTLQRLGHKSMTMSIEQSAAVHHDRLSLQLVFMLDPDSLGIVRLFGNSSSSSGPPKISSKLVTSIVVIIVQFIKNYWGAF